MAPYAPGTQTPLEKPLSVADHSVEIPAPFPVSRVRKRDGRIVEFDANKIASAIYKAILETGVRDWNLAARLSANVVLVLNQRFDDERVIPSVEDIQDIVEKVLLENNQAKIAKAYILYRQKRTEVRLEKQQILEKDYIDEVDKAFDLNALRVLKARYLRKDANGRLIETPKELFTRIAVHAALPDLLYDQQVYDISAKQLAHRFYEFEPEAHDGKFAVGKCGLNSYHLEALKRMYDRFNRAGHMKLDWNMFLAKLEAGAFNGYEKTVERFYELMVNKRFLPNTPAIANFGNVLGMGSACFVLGIDDSIESIMETLKNTAVIFKAGGGVGYNFSKLRPEGDYVSSTSGIASGPISFMTLFDTMTEVIKQGGIRRGANMGILNINHPDIEKFITTKKGNRSLRNFNISVLVLPDFWDYYHKNKPYPLTNPRTSEVVREVNPRLLFDMIVYQAWESAEPGVIFYDHVNKYNPFLKSLGPITTTNPCGEVLLYPNESCNLGSINVWTFAKERDDGTMELNWDGLKEAVIVGTRFLDNVIDVNKWPLKSIEEMGFATRKIGLGVMGLADLMYELSLTYNSEEGREFMEQLMEFVNYWSKIASVELAKERGPLPYFDRSFYPEGRLPFSGSDAKSSKFDWSYVVDQIRKHGIRNGYTTVIAPTGSISMIAGCSSGIEPVYALVFEKNVKVGSFYYVDSVFQRTMERLGLYDEQLMKDICENGGSIRNITYIPEAFKRVFVTSMDITPEDHIRALAAFQQWVDSSISKTNNFPADATVDDMRESYLLAYQLGCKDVTVFRDTSIKGQVLVPPKPRQSKPATVAKREMGQAAVPVMVGAVTTPSSLGVREYDGDGTMTDEVNLQSCPQCQGQVIFQEGCCMCVGCGWNACT